VATSKNPTELDPNMTYSPNPIYPRTKAEEEERAAEEGAAERPGESSAPRPRCGSRKLRKMPYNAMPVQPPPPVRLLPQPPWATGGGGAGRSRRGPRSDDGCGPEWQPGFCLLA